MGSIPLEERVGGLLPTIARLAAASAQINLPCLPLENVVPLGTPFQTAKAPDSTPWSRQCPFDLSQAQVGLSFDRDAQGSYKVIETNKSSAVSEHVTASFGVSAGCKLLRVSVTGEYDKNVVDNSGDRKLSKQASIRCGAVKFVELPKLTMEARQTLQETDGWTKFQSRYGDYWLDGHQLGADAALLLSEETGYHEISEKVSLKVTVKPLVGKIDKKTSKFTQNIDARSELQIAGFDTLSRSCPKCNSLSMNAEQQSEVFKIFAELDLNVDSLFIRARATLQQQHLKNGSILNPSQSADMARAGLFVESILRPFKHHREVIEILGPAKN